MVASLALGQRFGVAKGAQLVSVKYYGPTMAHINEGLRLALQHIIGLGREEKSVVVFPNGGKQASDPVATIQYDATAQAVYWNIQNLMTRGVPVITPAGNDRDEGREEIDFYPSFWEGDDYPIINVAEADVEGVRSTLSQAGPKVTVWAATVRSAVMRGDGKLDLVQGTSVGEWNMDNS
jgi:hypothetical protein